MGINPVPIGGVRVVLLPGGRGAGVLGGGGGGGGAEVVVEVVAELTAVHQHRPNQLSPHLPSRPPPRHPVLALHQCLL